MYSLVTGKFAGEKQAILAVRKLLRACVPASRVRAVLPEPGAVMVSVKATDNVCEALAVKVLRDLGARDIERRNAERRSAERRAAPGRAASSRRARKS